MSHCSTLEIGIARRWRVSIDLSLSIVGSRLTGHLVGRVWCLIGRALHLVVVEVLIQLLSLIAIVSLSLLLPLVTCLKGKASLGTLLVVVARMAATSLLLRRAEFPLVLLHLKALAL